MTIKALSKIIPVSGPKQLRFLLDWNQFLAILTLVNYLKLSTIRDGLLNHISNLVGYTTSCVFFSHVFSCLFYVVYVWLSKGYDVPWRVKNRALQGLESMTQTFEIRENTWCGITDKVLKLIDKKWKLIFL